MVSHGVIGHLSLCNDCTCVVVEKPVVVLIVVAAVVVVVEEKLADGSKRCICPTEVILLPN